MSKCLWRPYIVRDFQKPKEDGDVRLMFISDTHTHHLSIDFTKLPPVDIVLCAGDFTYTGKANEVLAFKEWFKMLNCKHRVLIAGNHELSFDLNTVKETTQSHYVKYDISPDEIKKIITDDKEIIYLEHDSVEIMGLKIFGSPYSLYFYNWAFATPDDPTFWESIPHDTDVFLVHGAPYNILDQCIDGNLSGDPNMLKAIEERKIPVVAFGHIHETYGKEMIDGTLYINASNCDFHYRCINPPVIVDMKVIGERTIHSE